MSGAFELRVVDRQGQLIAPLPEVVLDSVSWELNAPGAMDFSLVPSAPNANAIQLEKTEVQLWIDEQLRWWGVPRSFRGNSQRISVGCEGLMSYLFYRFILEEDLVYTNVDQLSVGASLVNYSQSAIQGTNPNLYIGIAAYANSGVLMTRTYTSDRKGSIMEPLKDLTTVDDGFDWDVEIFGNGTRLWTPYYPQKGQQKPQYALEYGRNIVDYDWEQTSKDLATKIDATGGTAEVSVFDPFTREKQNVIFEDTALSAEYGVHSAVLPSGAKSDIPWLTRRAQRAVAVRGRPITKASVTCRQGGRYPNLLDNVHTGDEVPVRIDHNMIQVSGFHRVRTKTWVPKGNRVKFEFTSVID